MFPIVRRAKTPETNEYITKITEELLNHLIGAKWRVTSHKHITFRSDHFKLEDLDGFCETPIDLTHLESLDVSCNQLPNLACIEGKSNKLAAFGHIQGTIRFQSLAILKANKNLIREFSAVLPQLRELDLSKNSLILLPPCAGFPKLEVLFLHDNRMTGDWDTLRQLDQLKKLDLSGNLFDYKPSEFNKQLGTLSELRNLSTLKIYDNKFTIRLPEYQCFVLARLKTLQRLDNITNMSEARLAAEQVRVAPGGLDGFDAVTFNRVKVTSLNKKEGHDEKSTVVENVLPSFQDLADLVTEALEVPSNVNKVTRQLVNLTRKIYDAEDSKMESIFQKRSNKRDISKESDEIEAGIQAFLGNYTVLIGRIEHEKDIRVMLFRSLAKLGVVYPHAFGEKCIETLGWLVRDARFEEEVLLVVKEIIVEPLENRNLLDQLTVPTVKGLAKFDSPRLPEILAPIAAWLARMYCNYGATPQKDITTLLAVATKNEANCAAALQFDAAGGQHAGMGGGSSGMQLPIQVISALDNKQLAQNESLREQYLGHLKIVANTARYAGTKVVEEYQDRSLHTDLMKWCGHFFGGDPKESQRPPEAGDDGAKQPAAGKQIDLVKMKTLDVRTCAALLDALCGLMSESPEILQELVDDATLDTPIVDFLLVAPKASPVPDPVLMSASIRGLTLVLDKFARENATMRKQLLERVIKDLASMKDLLLYLDDSSHKYTALFIAAEKHASEKSEGTSRKIDAVTAPPFSALINPHVHEAFVAIVGLVKFFTAEGKTDGTCKDVSEKMNENERERILFRLLEVPSQEVKLAVMECVEEVDLAEMSEEEVEILVKLLDNVTDIEAEESLLEKVINQLARLAANAKSSGGGATAALRNQHASELVSKIYRVFMANARRNTYGIEEEEEEKCKLSIACVKFLQDASFIKEMQPHMRSQKVNQHIIEVLKYEDTHLSIARQMDPAYQDIMVECTWTGRAVETLMHCFSGSERLNVHRKVAFRVIHRIANVLEGVRDHADADDRVSALAKKEAEMWDEARIRKCQNVLNDPERNDREIQHQLFAKFYGLDRLVQFLDGRFPEEERTQIRMIETTAIDDGKEFLKQSKYEADSHAMEHVAIADDGDIEEVRVRDALRIDVLQYPGKEFTGTEDKIVDLRLQKSYANLVLGGAMSIAFTARWGPPRSSVAGKRNKVLPKFSCIIDFGSGAPRDNIRIFNQAESTTLVFVIYSGTNGGLNRLAVPGGIEPGKRHRYLCTVTNYGQMRIYRDGDLLKEGKAGVTPRKELRTKLYVGRSLFEEDDNFVGMINELRVWDGIALDWDQAADAQDDIDEVEVHDEDSDAAEFDSVKANARVLVKYLNDPDDEDAPPREKQALRIGSVQPRGRDSTFNDEFFVPNEEGVVNKAYHTAAMLRCAFAVLLVPAAENIRKDVVRMLSQDQMVSRILSSVSSCGPFDCCVAAKFIRLMSNALELPPSQVEIPTERLIVYDIITTFCKRLCRPALNAAKQTADPTLAQRGRMLSVELITFACVVCRSTPCCSVERKPKAFHEHFVDAWLCRLVPEVITRFILEMVLHDPSSTGHDHKSDASFINDKVVKDTGDQNIIWELSRKVLSYLLERCHSRKYSILEEFSRVMVSPLVPMRKSFLSALLDQTSSGKDRMEMEKALNDDPALIVRPKSVVGVEPPDGGPEQTIFSTPVDLLAGKQRLEQPVDYPQNPPHCNVVVLSNKYFYIVDPTVSGHPSNPKILVCKPWADITRIVKGHVPQVVYLSWAASQGLQGEDSEEIMILICRRESDRLELINTIHALSEPLGGCLDDRVPLQSDFQFKRQLEELVTESILLCTFGCDENGETALFVLSEQHLYKQKVNFECWCPPSEDDPSDDESDGNSDDGAAVSDHRSKKLKASIGIPELHEKADEDEGSAADAATASSIRARIRKEASQERKAREHEDRTKPALIAAFHENKDLCNFEMKQIAEVKFHPGRPPEMMPEMMLTFTQPVGPRRPCTVRFFDDMSRENWRRHLMLVLNKGPSGADKWRRDYKKK